MRLPVDNWESWYIASGFGDKRTNYIHEAVDLNLKSGGDTDLGQPLFAISDGEITSVHNHAGIPTFGNHVHIQHDGPWGRVWSHSAHCQDIFVKLGDKIKEGQKIATLGKSGTQSSHLHFAIKKEPAGVDGIAKTEEDLKKWVDPIEFILEWARKTGGNMDWLVQYFNANFQIDLTRPEGDVRGLLQTLVDAKNRYIDSENKARKFEDEKVALAAELATWEERYQQAFSRGEELDAQIKERNRELTDKDQEIFILTKKLQDFEGKIAITQEEYEKLTSQNDLKKYSRARLLWEALKPLKRK